MASQYWRGRHGCQSSHEEPSGEHFYPYEVMRWGLPGPRQEDGELVSGFEPNLKQTSLGMGEDAGGEEEQNLLAMLAAGKTEIFWQLWERHRKYLLGVCIKQMGGGREEAEEALSKAMLRALERLPPHACEIKNLKYWLARLTHNVCIDIHRERQRREAKVEQLDGIIAGAVGARACTVESPEQAVLRREKFFYLDCVIAALPSHLRNPFLLRFRWLMSYRAIAQHLEITVENARKCVQQARARLRKGLTDYLEGTTGGPSDKSFVAAKTQPGWLSFGVDPPQKKRETAVSKSLKGKLVQVTLSSGTEMSYYAALSSRLTGPRLRAETLEKYIGKHPYGWRKRLALANLLYAQGRWHDAIDEYRLVVYRHPQMLEAWLQLGTILRLTGRNADARALYESMLQNTRSSAFRHHISGYIEVCRWRYEVAAAEFTKAAFLEPENTAHWNALGLARLREDSPEQALQAFGRALEIDDNDVVALTYSYGPLIVTGELTEAQNFTERLLSLDAYDALALSRLADLRIASGMVHGQEGRKTRELIRRALLRAPRAAFACASLVLYRLARGELEAGIIQARAFVERHSAQPCGWYYYAHSLWRGGRCEAAADAVMAASTLCRKGFEFKDGVGENVVGAWAWEEVENYFKELLRHFPETGCLWMKPGGALTQSQNR